MRARPTLTTLPSASAFPDLGHAYLQTPARTRSMSQNITRARNMAATRNATTGSWPRLKPPTSPTRLSTSWKCTNRGRLLTTPSAEAQVSRSCKFRGCHFCIYIPSHQLRLLVTSARLRRWLTFSSPNFEFSCNSRLSNFAQYLQAAFRASILCRGLGYVEEAGAGGGMLLLEMKLKEKNQL